MKRIATFLCLAICLAMLSGCVCIEGVTEVKSDGSVTLTTFMGMTADAVNEAINSGAELHFTPETTIVRNGVSYLGEYETIEYESLADFNTEGFYITQTGDSFALLFDATEQQEDIKDLASAEDAAEYQALMESAYIQLTVKFPLPITQTSGSSKGVTIDGNTLTLNMLEMKPKVYTFYSGQVGQFTDVSSQAWYHDAIAAMQASGLVNGYGGGVFGPTDNITLSAICTILARVDGAEVGAFTEGGYWAEKAIYYCLEKGYVNRRGDITSANYDVLATREEVTAAIARAYAGFNADGGFKADLDDKAGAIKNIGIVEDALRQLYNKTGYCAYIMTNPGTPINFQKVYSDVFGKATNGVIVALNYSGTKIANESTTYYATSDPAKACVAGLFDDDPDPIQSLLKNIDSVKEGVSGWQQVTIPDAANIAPGYLNDIKVAYKVGICNGVDSAGTFNPKANITRAEVCQLFYNIRWVTPGVA